MLFYPHANQKLTIQLTTMTWYFSNLLIRYFSVGKFSKSSGLVKMSESIYSLRPIFWPFSWRNKLIPMIYWLIVVLMLQISSKTSSFSINPDATLTFSMLRGFPLDTYWKLTIWMSESICSKYLSDIDVDSWSSNILQDIIFLREMYLKRCDFSIFFVCEDPRHT